MSFLKSCVRVIFFGTICQIISLAFSHNSNVCYVCLFVCLKGLLFCSVMLRSAFPSKWNFISANHEFPNCLVYELCYFQNPYECKKIESHRLLVARLKGVSLNPPLRRLFFLAPNFVNFQRRNFFVQYSLQR